MQNYKVSSFELSLLINKLRDKIFAMYNSNKEHQIFIYGVPRGGVPVAMALAGSYHEGQRILTMVDTPEQATFIVDDIIDSGKTRDAYLSQYPDKIFLSLIDKTDIQQHLDYPYFVIFPWEGDSFGAGEDIVVRLLQYIGENPNREGLLETPKRVLKAWGDWTSGYKQNPAEILKVFEDGAEGSDQMVIVADIPLYSHCEHHLAPFFGTATIAYIPDGKIVGLSKFKRLVDIFASRLQVQERLTNQIADALQEHLNPKGIGVHITARHMCMESRGVRCQGSHTETKALRGAMLTDPAARAEFIHSIK